MNMHRNKGRTCTIGDCARPAHAKSLCRLHYKRFLAHGDPLHTHRYEGRLCDVTGCGRVAKSRGWCAMHYRRWTKTGNPEKTSDFFTRTPSERFWSFVKPAPVNACWEWTGHIDQGGYGFFNRSTAHRFAWTDLRGEIPDGLHLDHLCRNTACVNPYHLDPVTRAENSRRAQRHRQSHKNQEHTNVPL